MSASVSKTSLYTGTSSISFSSLRTNFVLSASGAISASGLLRTTATSNTDPIVPDATENANIATTQADWKTSQFRNSIKYYDVIQSGTDENTVSTPSTIPFNIGNQTWNSNLAKNIKKVMSITGTIGSVSTGTYACYFSGSAYNLKIEVTGTGKIYGQGGAAAGQSGSGSAGQGGGGGPALYVNSSSGSVNVNLISGAQVYGGGAGGSTGANGPNGAAANCTFSDLKTITGGCNAGCPGCAAGEDYVTCGNQTYCDQVFKGPTYYTYTTTCRYYYQVQKPGAPGGIGGAGGTGKGYTTTRTDSPLLNAANGPTSGTTGGCPTYGGSGTDGYRGSNGEDWGTSSNSTRLNSGSADSAANGYLGAAAGRAITGANYTVTGSTVALKGLYQP